MRALLLATAALVATPATAQDHSAHASHAPAAQPDSEPVEQEPARHPATPDAAAHSTMDHAPSVQDETDHSAMDHAAMGHSSDHSSSHGATEKETVDHGAMDHGAMDHSTMDHSTMDHSNMDHSGMDHGAAASPSMEAPVSGPPARALQGPKHAADAIFGAAAMAPARKRMVRENGGWTGGMVMFDRLEAKIGKREDLYLWDAQGWYGGDIDKLWIKSEGEGSFGGGIETAEVQALWSHAIGPWFDLQAGARYDIEPEGRAHAVLGVQGLAPYMFEIDAAAYLSDRGDLTAGIEAEYDQRITQRLILQPRAELGLSAQKIPSIGLGSGLTSIKAGLRLRYEIAREFAPYVGVDYEAKLGRTRDLARAAGEDPYRFSFVIGVRAWF